MSPTPTGASAGLDGGVQGQEIKLKESVIGKDSTIESSKLAPLNPEPSVSGTPTSQATGSSSSQAKASSDLTGQAEDKLTSVLDSLADSQPGKTAQDLVSDAGSE